MKFAKGGFSCEGGYDDGYAACPCFWGLSPGSLVSAFLDKNASLTGRTVLDLGCGEGKNANAFALAGANVDAVDCSELAIANGKRAFGASGINWIVANAADHLQACRSYDIVVMYGLLHCLPSALDVSNMITLALRKTVLGGIHMVVAFNDGPHDLAGHPDFQPTLVSHAFYRDQYKRQAIISESDSILHESHPHNNIAHFHSISRLVAGITNELP